MTNTIQDGDYVALVHSDGVPYHAVELQTMIDAIEAMFASGYGMDWEHFRKDYEAVLALFHQGPRQ